MRHTAIILSLFSLSFLILTGCDKDGCKECQSSIDHMFDKIQGQACNPATMVNAVNSINNKCGATSGGIYVGFMAETCYLGRLAHPECSSHGDLKIAGLNINFQKTTMAFDPVRVDIKIPFDTKQIMVSGTGVYPVVLSKEIMENDEVRVEVFYGGNLIGSGNKKFTFDRNNYQNIRGVRLILSGPGVQVNFESW
jgi:hypothetical protein